MKKLLIMVSLIAWFSILAGCSRWPSEPYVIENPTDNYQEFSDVSLASAQDDGDTVVVYFGATRCPGCMALKNDIVANSDMIPDGVTILAADFDRSEELKEKYGVTKKTYHRIYYARWRSSDQKTPTKNIP